MLDERKAAILRAVVEEYIATAEPVGSGHVARSPDLQVSPATVRNEMAVLERDGYLVQPHTSAGRVPTDKGYRYFVDQLTKPGPLAPPQRQRVREVFAKAHVELEEMLQDTSRLLSELTEYAGVVVAPPPEHTTIRSVQLVGLGPRVALLVTVFSNGAVEKQTVELSRATGEERLAAASAHLAAHLTGRTLADLGQVPATGDSATDAAISAVSALTSPSDGGPEHVYVGGASRVAGAFQAVETVRRVLVTLEQQYVLVTLIREVLDSGASVAIGTEHGVEPLSECSIVVAPYEVEGEHTGTIAVLGPTRMHYPQALAAVAVVSGQLGRWLGENA